MDMTQAQKVFGFTPNVSLEDGLANTLDWYLKNVDEHKRKQNYFRCDAFVF